jgi:hypothetical protein
MTAPFLTLLLALLAAQYSLVDAADTSRGSNDTIKLPAYDPRVSFHQPWLGGRMMLMYLNSPRQRTWSTISTTTTSLPLTKGSTMDQYGPIQAAWTSIWATFERGG